MIQNTGKVRYRYLQKYYKPENEGDPLVPVLDEGGSYITKVNKEGDIDYYPDRFDFNVCGNEQIIPTSTTTMLPCPILIQGTSIDWFSPEFNIVSFELSSPGINKVGIEVIKSGNIVYTVQTLTKEGNKFNLRVNKYLTGIVTLRVIFTGCIVEENVNIDITPPSTTTTVDFSPYPCYNFSIYRQQFASGPELLDIKYIDCDGNNQILRLSKGGTAQCIAYLFRGQDTFIAVYPEQQQYINAGNISIGVVPCT